MSTEVTLPALGESVSEGTISRWLKAVGDKIEVDEPLLEISTDKVDTEIPSPVTGIVLELRYAEDDVAEVGSVLAVIGEPSDTSQAPAATPAEPITTEPEPIQSTSATAEPQPNSSATTLPENTSTDGTEITLPALGESVTEGTVSRWLKVVGDSVKADEPILEVSTDKVDTEIPSPVDGTLLEIRVGEDEIAQVGQVLGVVGVATAETNIKSAVTPPAPTAPAPVVSASVPAPEPTPIRAAEPPTPAPTSSPTARPSTLSPDRSAKMASAVARRAAETNPNAIYVTPLVRKMAAEHGIDLDSIKGTGVGGRIRKQDVLEAAKAKQQPAPTAPAAPKKDIPVSNLRGSTEKLPRLRKVIATRMTESLQTAAQLTATVEVDVTGITHIRQKAKDNFKKREGASLSYLPFITLATVEALKQFPIINASIDLEAGVITYPDAEHIGIAVDTPRGLLVPVLKNAGDLNVTGLAKKIGDLAARTRAANITPDELSGGTFTITNYGSAGTLFDTPIINQPESAIMGTGALVKRPVVLTDSFGNEMIAIRDMMYISLTYDHRIIDGAVAARFLSSVKARLEEADFGAEFGV